jgi:3-oxoacyl-[acyl-carrier-protein] synthase-1
MDLGGEWIMSHCVPFETPLRGRAKLAGMGAAVVAECLKVVDPTECEHIPLILCVAERTRPGRLDGLDDLLINEISSIGKSKLAADSIVVPHGRVSIAIALREARRLLYERNASSVLIVGTDSLLNRRTLREFETDDRILTSTNPNGFIPGDAAAGVLIGRPDPGAEVCITGIGLSIESARIDSDIPCRADGLVQALSAALEESGCEIHEMDLRLTDLSGEHYYFKEAALALTRMLRKRKAEFDLWHPAECVGEVGSAIGPILLSVSATACRKGYAPGPSILVHASNDSGERAAVVVRKVGN